MGGHSAVVPELESLTARYPLRERMWANLMLALYRSGRQAEALSTFERARQVLADELGADPSPELQRLHEQILHRASELGAPATGPAPPERQRIRPSRVDLQPSTEVAGYRIERTLGRGGMSVVYLAEHDWLQRKVALKVLAPQLAEDERFRERFVRESRLAASLDHPNVIPIYEAGASGGDLFIAMRYVEGTDLRTLLQESGALEPERAVAIVRQVAAALDAAHEQGLVHRDVKPGNVLLARQRGSEAGEHVYLSDFGLTKRSASDSGITGTGQFVGTLDYAAPEQFKGGTPDARTDVYSLGCVLFECLTGRPPFTSENDAGLMYAHLQAPPPSVTGSRPDLPREIDGVVATAMAKAPADRQAAAGALADEATRALGFGVAAGAAGSESRTRLRRLVPAIAVALALVVGIIVSSVFRGDAPRAGATGPPASAATLSPTPAPAFRTVDRVLSENEERLLTYVPEGVKANCLPLDRDEPVQGELATLVCRGSDLEVLYELFPTRDLMDKAFQVNVNNRTATQGECATDHQAVSPYSIGGEPAGRVLCYTVEPETNAAGVAPQPDRSHIEWTDDNSSIYAHAVRNDLGDLSLYDWWLSASGPVISSGDATATEKDAPSSLGPQLRDGSYVISLTPHEVKRYRFTFLFEGSSGGTVAIRLSDGTYEIGAKGVVIESGRALLQKPNAIVFDPEQAPCFPLLPVTYEWTAVGDTVTWEKTEGNDCAGPQLLTGIPWIRAPEGLIAFESGGGIGLMDAGGFVVKKLTSEVTTHPNISPAWSPDGSKIAFAGASEEGFDLYVMNADGTDIVRLTDLPGDETQPAWSPDGDRIAYSWDDLGGTRFRTGISVVNVDGTGSTELVSRENEELYGPGWSPDGSRLAFENVTRSLLFVTAPDGSDITEVHPDVGSANVIAGWTPDGRIAFRGVLDGKERLLSMRPDGSDVRVVLEDPPLDVPVMDWSSDGRWILMSEPQQTGTDEIYLLSADGDEAFYLGGGSEPRWRPGSG
jgi:tRNA A-37 threonylcarbamoyl transferase component Bud32